MNNYILYLAFGSKDFIHQTVYSILSLVKTSYSSAKDIQIVVYTDQPNYFKSLIPEINVIYTDIDTETIQEWMGEIHFFFRVKIKLIEDFFSKYPNSNLLYLDTDTFFIKNIDPVFQKINDGEYFMHEYEGVYDQNHPQKRKYSTARTIDKILKTKYFLKSNGDKFWVSNQTQLWNAGALGFNSNFYNTLPDVLLLTEQLYRLKDAHVMEQFSFSYFLQQSRPINPLEDYILHYWSFKEFNVPLAHFFEKYKNTSLKRTLDHLDEINPTRLIGPKLEYLKMPFLKRSYYKYFKGKWKMPEYVLKG
jgi:hypothetical protein